MSVISMGMRPVLMSVSLAALMLPLSTYAVGLNDNEKAAFADMFRLQVKQAAQKYVNRFPNSDGICPSVSDEDIAKSEIVNVFLGEFLPSLRSEQNAGDFLKQSFDILENQSLNLSETSSGLQAWSKNPGLDFFLAQLQSSEELEDCWLRFFLPPRDPYKMASYYDIGKPGHFSKFLHVIQSGLISKLNWNNGFDYYFKDPKGEMLNDNNRHCATPLKLLVLRAAVQSGSMQMFDHIIEICPPNGIETGGRLCAGQMQHVINQAIYNEDLGILRRVIELCPLKSLGADEARVDIICAAATKGSLELFNAIVARYPLNRISSKKDRSIIAESTKVGKNQQITDLVTAAYPEPYMTQV